MMTRQKEPVELTVARKINELDFAGAEMLLADWLDNQPENLRAQASLGRLRMMQSRFADASCIFETLTERQPNLASFHSCLGQCYSTLDNPLAQQAFHAAITLEPANPYYRKLLERHHLKRREGQLALAVYDDRLADDPTDLNSLLCRGQLLDTLGMDGAEACLRQAVDAGPEYMRPLLLLGGFLARQNRDDEAEVIFRRALEFSGPDQLLLEQRSRRISLYPCLELLWHAAMAACGHFQELNSALAEFTEKHARMLHDPRSFHDIVALDAMFTEYSYEEGTAFYFRRLTAGNKVHDYRDEARKLQIAWSDSQTAQEINQLVDEVRKLNSPDSHPAPLALLPADFTSRDTDTVSAEVRESSATLARSLTEIARAQSAERSQDEQGRSTAFRQAATHLTRVEASGFFPVSCLLVRAWLDVLQGNFTASNQSYHRYLNQDRDLSLTLLIFQHSGWFLMQ